jgi:hypothetical protein
MSNPEYGKTIGGKPVTAENVALLKPTDQKRCYCSTGFKPGFSKS